MEYEKQYFTEGGYKPYWDYPMHKFRAQKLVQMTHPKSVLDVGCAYGFIVRHLLNMGIYAVGMDISHWCEEQKVIPNNFVRHDLREPLPFKDKEFDLLYCEGVLEHIEEDKILSIMKEFERVSRERILALALSNYPDVSKPEGHLCCHDYQWWFPRIPQYTWLYVGVGAIDESDSWLYKG